MEPQEQKGIQVLPARRQMGEDDSMYSGENIWLLHNTENSSDTSWNYG